MHNPAPLNLNKLKVFWSVSLFFSNYLTHRVKDDHKQPHTDLQTLRTRAHFRSQPSRTSLVVIKEFKWFHFLNNLTTLKVLEGKRRAGPCLKLQLKNKKGPGGFMGQVAFTRWEVCTSPHCCTSLPGGCFLLEEQKQRRKNHLDCLEWWMKTRNGSLSVTLWPSWLWEDLLLTSWTHVGEEKQVVYRRADSRPRHFYISTYLLYLDTLMFLCNVSPLIILPSTLLR